MINEKRLLLADDLFDIVCLCHAALAQDSPESPEYYLNRILNISFGYTSPGDRKDIEAYLANKDYLPPAEPIQIVK